jgi:7-carboxy-7-deazaguanine synthase
MKTGQIQINEIFRSISGEAGTKDFPQGCLCTFVRLQGCNLKCSWCDTEQSQSDNEGIWKSLQEIQQACTGTRRVLITGGEPLTQEKPLLDLIFNLLTKGHVVQVETNGSIPIPYAPALSSGLSWVLDYKMPSSGMHNKMMNSLLFFEAITRRNAIIKFVYDNLDDGIVTFDKMKLLKVMYSMKGIKPDFPPFVLSPTVNARSLDIMIDHKKIIERIFKEGLQEFCMVSVQSHKILDLK